MNPTCGMCMYWLQLEPMLGMCKRRAPCPVPDAALRYMDTQQVGVLWPITKDTDWCGEFQMKPQMPPPGPPGMGGIPTGGPMPPIPGPGPGPGPIPGMR